MKKNVPEKIIHDEVDRLVPGYAVFLSGLVKIDSVFGREKKAQAFVKSKMDSLGLDTRSFYSRDDDESVNLAATIQGSDPKDFRSLLLNAHCDIAPVECAQKWAHDPFSGEIADAILFGRGAQDDKAGIAVILLIVNLLKNLDIRLKGDLIIESVIEDESTGNGSRILVENGYTGDGVVICDGTWSQRIIYAHLGQVWIDADIEGDPVAACVHERGVNPVPIAVEFARRVSGLIEALNTMNYPFEGIARPYFMNIGSIHAGVWHGSVPAHAKMQMQIGFSAQHTPDDIITEITKIAQDLSPRIRVSAPLLKTGACAADKNNRLIVNLKSIIERNQKKEVTLVPVTGHCDMRHFPTRDICLYGPGGGKNAHGIDEQYYLDQMPIVAKNLIDLVLSWCNEPRGQA